MKKEVLYFCHSSFPALSCALSSLALSLVFEKSKPVNIMKSFHKTKTCGRYEETKRAVLSSSLSWKVCTALQSEVAPVIVIVQIQSHLWPHCGLQWQSGAVWDFSYWLHAEEEANQRNIVKYFIKNKGLLCPNCSKSTHAHPRVISNTTAQFEVNPVNVFLRYTRDRQTDTHTYRDSLLL